MRDYTTIYLLQAGTSQRYALSVDKTGANVPFVLPGWFLRGELDHNEFPDEFEPALANLKKRGFSIVNVEDASDA